MDWDDHDYYDDYLPAKPGPEDDPSVRAVEPLLLERFDNDPDRVFYESQLAVIFEARFFHWVTTRALKALRESGRVGSQLQEFGSNGHLRLYFHKRNRYWKRKGEEVRKLVQQFSDQSFTNSLGLQGELLTDAGLPRVGFLPAGSNLNTWQETRWNQTGHDLDRVFIRDGIAYGTEIKNRLGYIPQEEFTAKLRMCLHLNLTPLFIARMMPRTYIEEVRKAGGFSLLMKWQFYPTSHRELAHRVKTELELPVDCPARLQDSTLQRLLNWHLKQVDRKKRA